MKTPFFASSALAGLLVLAGATGCAQNRLHWFGSSAGSSQHADVLHPPSSGGAVRQKSCPVTGGPLDSMGGSIPVSANGETIYVCCRGCVNAVKKNPQKYLAIVQSES